MGRSARCAGLSQTFPDQCASCVRRRYGLTFGYGSGFQTAEFLSMSCVEYRFGRAQLPYKSCAEKLCDRPPRCRQGLGGAKRRQPARPLAAQRRPRTDHRPAQCLPRIARSRDLGARNNRLIHRTAVYGPVCTVVWEGRSREASPIPNYRLKPNRNIHGACRNVEPKTDRPLHFGNGVIIVEYWHLRCRSGSTWHRLKLPSSSSSMRRRVSRSVNHAGFCGSAPRSWGMLR